jgi:hypothetical protein
MVARHMTPASPQPRSAAASTRRAIAAAMLAYSQAALTNGVPQAEPFNLNHHGERMAGLAFACSSPNEGH